jgi:hypothetical protein
MNERRLLALALVKAAVPLRTNCVHSGLVPRERRHPAE